MNHLRWLLFAWLAWRGGVGFLARVHELGSSTPREYVAALLVSEDERLERTLADQDRRQRLPAGYHFALFRALRDDLPPSGVIYVRQRPGRMAWPGGRALPALHHLLAPAAFRPAPFEYGVKPATDGSSLVLDFDDELRALLEPHLEPVARGADWTLWR